MGCWMYDVTKATVKFEKVDTSMTEIKEYFETELTEDIARPIAELAMAAFQSSRMSIDQRVARMLSAKASKDPEMTTCRRYVIWEGGQAIAHARIFIRVVTVEDRDIPVLALATVCSHPDFRGKGLGAKVTLRAFELIGQVGWPDVSLFQTPVAPFYEKLNSRIVTNKFVNGTNEADPMGNPWRDDTQMIYPSEYAWPEGTVDLNGPDY